MNGKGKFGSRSRRRMGAFGVFLVTGVCLLAVAVPKGFAEGGRKGPAVEDVPDLDEVIRNDSPPPSGGAKASAGGVGAAKTDPDTESLNDLEKVIEMEDTKPATVVKAPPSSSTPPPAAEKDTTLEDLQGMDLNDKDELPPDLEEPAPAPPPRKAAAAPKPPPQERVQRSAPAPREEAPPPAPATPTLPSSPVPAQAVGLKNTITNLEFRMDGTTSRLIITARAPLKYREVRNTGMRQVVYFFDNTETPDRLQRAYDTSEFPSAVALFTLLQVPGEKPPASKLIIQLREDKEPIVSVNDRGLHIDFSAPNTTPIRVGASTTGATAKGGANGSKVLLDGDIYFGNQTFTGKRIKRLEIKNSDVADVLRLIAKTSGYNIVVGDDVAGKVNTMSLENVPWDQAFALVLQSKKLGYVVSGSVIRVGTLNSLKNEKDEALANEQAKIRVEPLRTVIVPISFAKASDLAPHAKSFLSPRGSVDVDQRTNTIVLKDIEKIVARVQKLFVALDTAPPRVAISARFVEMTKRFESTLNSILQINTSFSGLNMLAASNFGGSGNQLQLTSPQFANLQAKFDISEGEGNVKTLANPSVTVVANQKASVNQSFSFFVPGADQAAVGVLAVPTLKQITTNLQLDVTPIVAGDGSIFMNLAIKNEIPNPKGAQTTIDGRNVVTQVLIDNGDTAVVGGIFSNTYTKSDSGFPILRSFPVIGSLFNAHTENTTRSEIFIFITAKITNAEDSFRRNL